MSNAKSNSKQSENKIQNFVKDMIKGEYDKHMDQNFINRGFTDVINIPFDKELTNLQKLIYLNTL